MTAAGRRALAIGVVGALAFAGACGSTGPAAGPSPSAAVSRSPDPYFDFGQTVFITDTTVRPLQLITAVNRTIRFVNQSGQSVDIHFDNYGSLDSGPIPPGGAYAFEPHTTVSITFHVVEDPTLHGAIQVQPTVGP